MPRFKVTITGEVELETEKDFIDIENDLFNKVDLGELKIEWQEIE